MPNGSNAYIYDYYLTDHLGNSRVVFDSHATTATALQTDDYYAFGMDINSYVSGSKNEYLYNKKELQVDLANQYDYGARFYDPVIARFNTIDAYAEKYSSMTPYQYGALNTIKNVDVNGDSIRVNTTISIPLPFGGNTNVNVSLYYQGGTAHYQNGTVYSGDDRFVAQVGKALNDLSAGSVGRAQVNDLEASTNNTTIINDSRDQGNLTADDASQVRWNPNGTLGGPDQTGSQIRPSFIGFGHELAHVQDILGGTIDRSTWYSFTDANDRVVNIENAEKYATYVENQIRAEHHLSLREFYSPTPEGGGYEPSRILRRGTSTNMWIHRDNPIEPPVGGGHVLITPTQLTLPKILNP